MKEIGPLCLWVLHLWIQKAGCGIWVSMDFYTHMDPGTNTPWIWRSDCILPSFNGWINWGSEKLELVQRHRDRAPQYCLISSNAIFSYNLPGSRPCAILDHIEFLLVLQVDSFFFLPGILSCPGWMSVADAGWRSRRSKHLIGRVGNSCAGKNLLSSDSCSMPFPESGRDLYMWPMSLCMLPFAENALPYSPDLGFVFITLISQKLFHWANCELWRVIGISFPFLGKWVLNLNL